MLAAFLGFLDAKPGLGERIVTPVSVIIMTRYQAYTSPVSQSSSCGD